MRRFYRYQKLARVPASPLPADGGVDRLLQRLSHISQFGLFIMTVGMIKFTVIPLYEKAMLDEAVARKELELSSVNKELVAAYSKIRNSAIKSYVIYSGAKCSGVLEPVRSGEQDEELPFELRIDVLGCLLEELNAPSLDSLAAQDRYRLEKEVRNISKDIALKQKALLLEYSTVSERVRSGRLVLPVSDLYSENFGGLLPKNLNPDQKAEIELDIAIRGERLRISSECGDAIRDAVFSLREIQWEE